MQTYRLSAWDLNTNVLLTDLEGKDVSFNERLSDAGEFSMRLSLTDAQTKELTAVILGLDDTPFKLLITANDNTRILYAGIAWKPSLSSSSDDLVVSGKAIPDWFRMITMANDYQTPISPVTLIQNAVADAQTKGYGYALGIQTRAQVTVAPPNATPDYPKSRLGTVAQILSDMTASVTTGTGGVDFYMEHAFVNGVPQHTMVVCSPRAGRTSATSPFFVDLATATDFTRDADATASGNHIYVAGQGSGGVQPVKEAYAPFSVGGLGQPPRLEQVYQYSQISDHGMLQKMADGMIRTYGRPVAVMTVQIPADYESMELGSYTVGDDVRVWVEKDVLPQFPKGLDEWWRVVAYRVDISNEGHANVTLTLNRPPIY